MEFYKLLWSSVLGETAGRPSTVLIADSMPIPSLFTV